jgi:hypothetical protein
MAMALETVFEEACSTLLVRLDDRLKPSARPRPDGRKFLTAASFITIIILTAVAAFMFLPKLFKVQATLPRPEGETAEVQNRPGQTAAKRLEAPESAGPAGASASSAQVAGPSQDNPAKAPQPAKLQSSSELSQAQMKEKLQKQAELGKKVAAGAGLYSRGDFAGCLKVMEEVLSADEQNSEARRYRYLASTALARQDILNLLERQRLAEEEKDLPSLLQDFGPAELVRQKRDETLLLFNYYDQILSVHSNISLTWPAAGRAEVRFGRLLTAVYKKTGERKVLADSVQVWSLEKKGQEWKVTQVRGQ